MIKDVFQVFNSPEENYSKLDKWDYFRVSSKRFLPRSIEPIPSDIYIKGELELWEASLLAKHLPSNKIVNIRSNAPIAIGLFSLEDRFIII